MKESRGGEWDERILPVQQLGGPAGRGEHKWKDWRWVPDPWLQTWNFHYCYFYTFSFIIHTCLYFFLHFCKFPSLSICLNVFLRDENFQKYESPVAPCSFIFIHIHCIIHTLLHKWKCIKMYDNVWKGRFKLLTRQVSSVLFDTGSDQS